MTKVIRKGISHTGKFWCMVLAVSLHGIISTLAPEVRATGLFLSPKLVDRKEELDIFQED